MMTAVGERSGLAAAAPVAEARTTGGRVAGARPTGAGAPPEVGTGLGAASRAAAAVSRAVSTVVTVAGVMTGTRAHVADRRSDPPAPIGPRSRRWRRTPTSASSPARPVRGCGV
ncbi:hypothetical protein GCM10023216_14840 [Isoptericola chiayiensis]|uniref:Uncharacterized protein n=1 Tax=Isoptericola chiayiensis TaxID=579446 RepID=A0ABP8YBW5_9MICO